jgi:putative PIN family toxin of toxin-antitoxin system
MPLTPELIDAYENTLYAIEGGPVLRIGEPSAALEELLEAHGAASAAFVTAANPRGAPRSHAANDAAMAALRAALAWPFLPGEGRDPQGRWSAEPSLLVLDIAREAAEALGRRFDQNAIVFVAKGAAPELVLLEKMRLVIDTQVWLDWLVFDDPSVAGLRAAIDCAFAEVLIDAACLAELERVLAYPLGRRTVDAAACLAACRRTTTTVEGGSGQARAHDLPVCRDPDDQKFLTLAARARADCLVSRDRELLRLNRRCAPRFQIVPPCAFVNFVGRRRVRPRAG